MVAPPQRTQPYERFLSIQPQSLNFLIFLLKTFKPLGSNILGIIILKVLAVYICREKMVKQNLICSAIWSIAGIGNAKAISMTCHFNFLKFYAILVSMVRSQSGDSTFDKKKVKCHMLDPCLTDVCKSWPHILGCPLKAIYFNICFIYICLAAKKE